MFSFLKSSLAKIYSSFTHSIASIFSRPQVDEALLQDLEKLLISADTGTKTTRLLIDHLRTMHSNNQALNAQELKRLLHSELIRLLTQQASSSLVTNPSIYLLVGINGSGKTTSAAKLAGRLQQQGKKVLLVAADTFRAAAVQQLCTWAQRLEIPVVSGTENQDPSSVVFMGCQRYKNEGYDALIIDTAGRLQTKTNLMRELEKIKKVIARQLPDASLCTLLTVDAMLGQNSFQQAQLFNESSPIQGIILTKMDGTGKGGIVFSIVQELKIPITYLSCGETVDTFRPFDPHEYVAMLLGE